MPSYCQFVCHHIYFFFFFNDTATTEIYTLSLHDALPISLRERIEDLPDLIRHFFALAEKDGLPPKKLDTLALERQRVEFLRDRKSTRLNSSHTVISYAVFCLKKKKNDTAKTRVHATPTSR